MLDESDKAKATLDDLKKTYSVDEKRVNLLGFSAGCAMDFEVIATYLWRLGANYSVGADDRKYIEAGKKSAEKLKALKFDCSTDFPAKVGHTCTLEQVKRLTAFLDEVYAKDLKAARDAKAPKPSSRPSSRPSSKPSAKPSSKPSAKPSAKP